VKDSIFSFYTTARKARFSAYAVFALVAFCYIAVNSLLFHRSERDISYEVIWLLASLVAAAPVAYHFIFHEKEKRVFKSDLFEELSNEVAQLARELAQAREIAKSLQPQPLRLLLAEDRETTEWLRILSKEKGFDVVAEASDGKEALEKALSLKPDLVLLDMQMPGPMSGLEVTREITKILSNTKVLVLGVTNSPSMERKAIDAGAIGYLHKEHLVDRFDGILETIIGNKILFDSTVSPIAAKKISRFTRRQLEIVKLIAMHKTIEEISLTLGVSAVEIKRERLRIMEELDLFSTDAVLYADRHKVSS